MKKSAPLISVALLMVFLLVGISFISGCSEKTVTNTSQGVPTYKVGVSGGTPVFSYLGKDGTSEGFEIDLMKAIAHEGGFQPKFEITSRKSRVPALNAKQIDIILAVMTITDERKKAVDFSEPYFETTLYILVPADSAISCLDDLKGRTVACSLATTADIALTKFLGKDYEGIKRFKDTTPALMEVSKGYADAAVADGIIISQYVKNNPEASVRIVKDSKFPKEYYGMAVRKGDKETLGKINRGLTKIRENGQYDKVYQKWFGN